MAKKRRIVKRKKTSSRKKTKKSSLNNFLKSERTHFLAGVVVAFTGLFVFLSMISFLFTGGADQSKVINKTFFELVNDKTLSVDNWTGAGGAFIAQALINDWFGIFAILLPLFVILIGMRWMKVWEGSLVKSFIFTSLSIIFGSIASAFILGNLFSTSFINWGGKHGNTIEYILENSIGWPGIILLIVLFVTILVVVYKKASMFKIQNTLSKGIQRINNNGTESEEEDIEDIEFEKDTEELEKTKENKKPGIIRKIIGFFGWKKPSSSVDKKSDEEETDDLPIKKNHLSQASRKVTVRILK